MSLRLVTLVACLMGIALGSGWTDLFQPPYASCPTVMMALSCSSTSSCYVPGGSNGQGFNMYLFNGAPNGAFHLLNMPSKALMIMAIGMGGTRSAPHGSIGGMGLGNGIQYPVNATTFEPSLVPELMVVTQDVRASSNGMDVLVVDNAGSNAVLFSSNGGVAFSEKKITSKMPASCTGARYGAMLSATTWYVTLGSWPSNKEEKASATFHPMSARVSMQRDALTGKTKRVSKNMISRVQQPIISAGPSNDIYTAVIAKTTDGGNTWTNLFSAATNFYFNAIDCISPTQCVAVGEGFDSGAGVHIYHTDNGKTFTQVFSMSSSSAGTFSLMSVEYASTTEVWAAGSTQSSFAAQALFVQSKDGGKTWKVYASNVTNIGDISDLSFLKGQTGFATAVTVYDDSTILKYTP